MGAAGDLTVTGWVRNRREGYVEVVAEGNKEELDKLLLILQRGSRSSLVTEVKENWQDYTGEFQGFSVRATL
jgi:acylphosphatase